MKAIQKNSSLFPWFAGCLLVAGCATGTPTITPKERAYMLVAVANGALDEGDPSGALQNLARAEKEDASIPEIYHSRALAFYAKKDFLTALENARKAVALKPDYPEANNTLGKILVDLGRYNEAQKPLKTAATNPLNREAYKAWTNLGIASYRQEQYQAAEEYFTRAVQDAPSFACVGFYYLGHLQVRRRLLSAAVDSYQSATRKACAGFKEAFLALGGTYLKTKQYAKARKTFLEIKERFPNTKIAEQASEQLKAVPQEEGTR